MVVSMKVFMNERRTRFTCLQRIKNGRKLIIHHFYQAHGRFCGLFVGSGDSRQTFTFIAYLFYSQKGLIYKRFTMSIRQFRTGYNAFDARKFLRPGCINA